jgi:endonuclease YncB( thermonuclease family)
MPILDNTPNPNRQNMISLPVITRGETHAYNAVLEIGLDWPTLHGWLHGTVTSVTDGDTIRLRLDDETPFSYPGTSFLASEPDHWVTDYARLIPADQTRYENGELVSQIELQAGAEVIVRLAGINTPEYIYSDSTTTTYKYNKNKSYCTLLELDCNKTENTDKVARVAAEAKDLTTGLLDGQEIWVYLDIFAKNTSYTVETSKGDQLCGAEAPALDDYGRFVGEVYIVPNHSQSALFPGTYSYIYLNPTLIANNSVHEAKVVNPEHPADYIPIAMIESDYFVSKKTADGATDGSVMKQTTRLNPLLWQMYLPDYDALIAKQDETDAESAEIKANAQAYLSLQYRMSFADDGKMTAYTASDTWQDPSAKARDMNSPQIIGDDGADESRLNNDDQYCWRNLVPAETEDEDYEHPTIDDRDALDGMSWEMDEALGRRFNRKRFGNHYCRIGDCTLPIPPTAIKVTAQASSSGTQTLRSKTSLKIQDGKTERTVTLTCFFADPDMVDGERLVHGAPLPGDPTRTVSTVRDFTKHQEPHEVWYRNGLRPLIAQIQHAPFLPVENELLNDTFKIFGLAFQSLATETVPGYPGMIAAVLTFKEFDHTVFMPAEEYFAGTFCWPLFRWYYQRFMQESAQAKGRTYLPPVSYYDQAKGRRVISTEQAVFLTIDETALQMRQYAIDKLNNRLSPDVWSKSVRAVTTPSGNSRMLVKCWEAGKNQAARWWQQAEQASFSAYPLLWTADPAAWESGCAAGDTPAVQAGLVFGFHRPENVGTHLNSAFQALFTDATMVDGQTQGDLNALRYAMKMIDILQSVYLPGEPIAWIPMSFKEILSWLYDELYLDQVYGNKKWIVEQSLADVGIPSQSFLSLAKHPEYPDYVTLASAKIKDLAFNLNPWFYATSSLSDTIMLRVYDDKLRGMAKANAWNLVDNKWLFVSPTAQNGWYATLDEYLAGLVQSKIADNLDYTYTSETNKYLALAHMLEADLPVVASTLGKDFILAKASVTMNNQLVPLPMIETGAVAYQYLGGGEKAIQLQFTTKSRAQVSELMRLFAHSQRLAREYRVAIVSSLVKIQHPLLALYGIVDVLFESINVETAGPELFTIDMSLVGFDKTQRIKEDLDSAVIQINGTDFRAYDFKTMSDFDNVWNFGSYSSRKRNQSDFDMGHVDLHLKNLEIYPDLELPTYDEVNQALPDLNILYRVQAEGVSPSGVAGTTPIQFTKLPNRQNARFVDPDFYIRCDETFVDYLRLLLGDNCNISEQDQFRHNMVLRDDMGGSAVLQTPSPTEQRSATTPLKQNPITLSDNTESFLIDGLKEIYYGMGASAAAAGAVSVGSVSASRINTNDVSCLPASPKAYASSSLLDTIYCNDYLSLRKFAEMAWPILTKPNELDLKRWGFYKEQNYQSFAELFFVQPAEGQIRGALMYYVQLLMPGLPEDKAMADLDNKSTTIGKTLLSPGAITKEKVVNTLQAGLHARHCGQPFAFLSTDQGLVPQIKHAASQVQVTPASFDPAALQDYRFGLSQRLYRPGRDTGASCLEELWIASWCWSYDLYLYVRDFAKTYQTVYDYSHGQTGERQKKIFYQILDWTVLVQGHLDGYNVNPVPATALEALVNQGDRIDSSDEPVRFPAPYANYWIDVFWWTANGIMPKWAASNYVSSEDLTGFKHAVNALSQGLGTAAASDAAAADLMREKADMLRTKTESFYRYVDPILRLRNTNHQTLAKYLESKEDPNASKVFNIDDDGFIMVHPFSERARAADSGYTWVYCGASQSFGENKGNSLGQRIKSIAKALSLDISAAELLEIGFMLMDPQGQIERWQDAIYGATSALTTNCGLADGDSAYGNELRFYAYPSTTTDPGKKEDPALANIVPDDVFTTVVLEREQDPFSQVAIAFALYLGRQNLKDHPELKVLSTAVQDLTDKYYLSIKIGSEILNLFSKHSQDKKRVDVEFKLDEATDKLQVRIAAVQETTAGNSKNLGWSEYYAVDTLLEPKTYSADPVATSGLGLSGVDVQTTTMAQYVKAQLAPKLAKATQFNYRNAWLDMIRFNRHGRLVRAFPTFQLFIINEGQWLSWQKLWDNFYGYSSVIAMDLIKDRRFAADTLIMQLSNLYHNLSSYDTELSYGEVDFNAMWLVQALTDWSSPEFSAITGITNSLEQLNVARNQVNSLMLRPGARLHLRLGYSADASALPVVFNGTITEMDAQDIITLAAQGDGLELLSKFQAGPDETTKDNRSIIISGAEPRDYLCGMLSGQKGFFASAINRAVDGMFYNKNPLGLVHFGEQKVDSLKEKWGVWLNADIDDWGELGENIHSANGYDGKSAWKYVNGRAPASEVVLNLNTSGICPIRDVNDEPNIAILLYDRSAWDVVQTFAMCCPDYIATVIPFGMRSSLFFGKPWFGCTYDYQYQYQWNSNWNVVERKISGKQVATLSQFHLYGGAFDIISNQIEASEKYLYTNVVGVYGRDGAKQTHLIQMDSDIHTEKQKTAYVRLPLDGNDTITKLGDILFNPYGTRKAHAENAALSALRDYAKEMYQGELIVLGDPSVKPYDTVYMSDNYTRMNGSFWVKRVVHQFSMATGFITSVSPDLVNIIDDKEAISYMGWLASTATGFFSITAGRFLAAKLWKKFWSAPAGMMIKILGSKTGTAVTARVLESLGDLTPLQKALLGSIIETDESIIAKLAAATSLESADEVKDAAAKILSKTETMKAQLQNKDVLEAIVAKYNVKGERVAIEELQAAVNDCLKQKNPQQAILAKVAKLRTEGLKDGALEAGKLDKLIDVLGQLKGTTAKTTKAGMVDMAADLAKQAKGETIDATEALARLSTSLTDDILGGLTEQMDDAAVQAMVKSKTLSALAEVPEAAREALIKKFTGIPASTIRSMSTQSVRDTVERKVSQILADAGGDALETVTGKIIAKAAVGDTVARFTSKVVSNRIVQFLTSKGVGASAAMARAAYGLVGFLGPQAIVSAIVDVAFTVIAGSIIEGLSRALRYRQALVLMPLQYNDKEFVAGIDGFAGCVVGSEPSGLDKFFAGTGFLHGMVGLAYGILGVTAPDYATEDNEKTLAKALTGGTTLRSVPVTSVTALSANSSTSATVPMATTAAGDGVSRRCLGIATWNNKEVTAAMLDAAFQSVKNIPERSASILPGLGVYFLAAQSVTGVNALFIAAIAVHETLWGTSKLALEKKNLFGVDHYLDHGLSRFDHARTYADYGQSIAEVAVLLKDNYLTPGGKNYHGPTIAAVGRDYCEGNSWAAGVSDAWDAITKRIP